MNYNRYMKKAIAFATSLMFVVAMHGQTTITYTPSSSVIANPERGWYDQYSSHSGAPHLEQITISFMLMN